MLHDILITIAVVVVVVSRGEPHEASESDNKCPKSSYVEKWEAHAYHTEMGTFDGFLLDLGSAPIVNSAAPISAQQHDRRNECLYEGRGIALLNIGYAKRPVKRFEKAELLSSKQDFESMLKRRRAYAERKAKQQPNKGKSNNVNSSTIHAKAPPERDESGQLLYTTYGSICPQRLTVGDLAPYYRWMKIDLGDNEAKGDVALDEDCLSLNIFLPDPPFRPTKSKPSFPVFVFIHGGSLNSGSAAQFGIKGMVRQFTRHGVIVVTLQYRLGPFGFFNFKHNPAVLNVGLEDQLLALQWIQRYIHLFGGDPRRVTLAGQSAGAGSVGILALELFRHSTLPGGNSSGQSTTPQPPLFNQLLLMSATAGVVAKDALTLLDARATILDKLTAGDKKPLDYNEAPDNEVRKRLEKASVLEILRADKAAGMSSWDFELREEDKSMGKRSRRNSHSGAAQSHSILRFDKVPRALFQEQLHQNGTRILMWSMRDEWALFDPRVHTKLQWAPWMEYKRNYAYIPFRMFAQPYLARYGYHMLPSKHSHSRHAATFHFDEWFDEAYRIYSQDVSREKKWRRMARSGGEIAKKKKEKEATHFTTYIQMMSDWVFTGRVARDARRFAENNKVHLYKFTHGTPMPERGESLSCEKLVPHEADLKFVFMPERFWLLRDELRADRRHLDAADETARILLAFIRGEKGRYFPDEMAIKGEPNASLPYMEWSTKTVRRPHGFLHERKDALWRRLIASYRETPFAKSKNAPEGAPYAFSPERRRAVGWAVAWEGGLSVAKGLVKFGVGKLKKIFRVLSNDTEDLISLAIDGKKAINTEIGLNDIIVPVSHNETGVCHWFLE